MALAEVQHRQTQTQDELSRMRAAKSEPPRLQTQREGSTRPRPSRVEAAAAVLQQEACSLPPPARIGRLLPRTQKEMSGTSIQGCHHRCCFAGCDLPAALEPWPSSPQRAACSSREPRAGRARVN